jgi:DNA-binding transcriptional LysR family regulator
VIGLHKLWRLVEEFESQGSGTRLRFLHEVLGGTWDSLASGRADLAIGVSGDAPAGQNYATHILGRVEMVFAAAPFHPICKEPLPLDEATIQRYRGVSVADSSRLLPPRTVGLVSGQDVLTVPSMESKASAQVAGLGVGALPRWTAEREAAAGRLVILPTAASRSGGDGRVAWRPGQEGRALKWFVRRLEDPLVAAELLS